LALGAPTAYTVKLLKDPMSKNDPTGVSRGFKDILTDLKI